MAYDMVKHTTQALNSLRADIDWLAILDDESLFSNAGLKWRTFTVEFNPKQDYVRLPTLMVETVGYDLGRFVTLNDPAYNEIEVLVEHADGDVCFSQGWLELNTLYDLKHGGAVTLVNVEASRFVIQVKDRYGEEIKYPHHDPPMTYKLDQNMFPLRKGSVFTAKPIVLYKHDPNNFTFSFSKWLSVDEADKGFLTFSYDRVLESVLPINTKYVSMTDDTGHIWKCTVSFVRAKEPHYKFEGDWKKFCLSRKVMAWSFIRIGAPKIGANSSLFITLKF